MKSSNPLQVRESPRRSFLSGVSVLTVSALIVKVIGLFYRIPLLRVLGTEGMGYFNTAYELYALFCVVATAGLPVAMSVLISARNADGDTEGARRVYRVALGAFLVIGALGTLLLWGLATPFARLLGNEEADVCMRAIAPTVFLICLSSAHRGYFQGYRNMVPTALSQIAEAAGKLVLGLLFAAYARARGWELPRIAASAVMGLTVGTAVSVIYLVLHKRITDRRAGTKTVDYVLHSGENSADDTSAAHARPSNRSILRALAATAIPVTLGAGVIGLTKCIDLALILRRLQACGSTVAEANALYGCYSTLAVPIFNVLPSLSTSVSLSGVPTLSAALRKGKDGWGEVRRTAYTALSVTLLLSIPGGLGLSLFAEDILTLLFAGQPAAVAEATPWLCTLGLSIPAACLVTVTGGMLQAAGYASRPIISMLCGVGAKTLLAYILLGMEGWGMAGVPLSSLVCDTVIVVFNLIFIARHVPAMMPGAREGMRLFWPLLCAAAAVGLTIWSRRVCGWSSITPAHTIGAVFSVMCLYGAGILLLSVFRRHPRSKERNTPT